MTCFHDRIKQFPFFTVVSQYLHSTQQETQLSPKDHTSAAHDTGGQVNELSAVEQ